MITRIDNFISKEECQKVSDSLRNIPSECFKDHSYIFILGTNLYEYKDINQYRKSAMKTNVVLQNNFQWLYDKVKLKLSQVLSCDVEYDDTFSFPGFQLYPYNEQVHTKSPARIWHYDDEKLGFPIRPVDYDITITLLIETPGVSSYQYFPCTHSLYTTEKKTVCKEHVHLKSWQTCPNPDCQLNDNAMETIFYDVGTMVITKDRYLHRIGPTEFHDETKQRITLQGHGYFKNNKLYLHW
jgi:hypothetical protein